MSENASLGPVQYIIVAFPGNRFKGEILPALQKLVSSGTIRVMDLAFVKKDVDGSIMALELEDLSDDEAAPFAAFEKQVGDLLNMDDLEIAAEALEPNASAAVLVWENIWAREFADALRGAGGLLIAWDSIPREAVEAAMAAAAVPVAS